MDNHIGQPCPEAASAVGVGVPVGVGQLEEVLTCRLLLVHSSCCCGSRVEVLGLEDLEDAPGDPSQAVQAYGDLQGHLEEACQGVACGPESLAGAPSSYGDPLGGDRGDRGDPGVHEDLAGDDQNLV